MVDVNFSSLIAAKKWKQMEKRALQNTKPAIPKLLQTEKHAQGIKKHHAAVNQRKQEKLVHTKKLLKNNLAFRAYALGATLWVASFFFFCPPICARSLSSIFSRDV